MDADLLNAAPDTIPPDVDAGLWLRYIRGAAAFDLLWQRGQRCPMNDGGVKCKCEVPKTDYCRYFKGVAQLAEQIGGPVAAIIKGMK